MLRTLYIRLDLWQKIAQIPLISIIFDNNWYHNLTPQTRPYRDTHVITYIPVDMLKYKEPTQARKFNKS